MRVLDLFSGIGGFTLGLERAGLVTVAFCEVSAICRHLLAHHWPEVPCYEDVRALTAERLVADGIDVDALCGGFPCQDLSFAGKGAGLSGERSGLWFEIARLLRELRDIDRPVRVVVLENVSALLSRGLGVVLGDLAALGYDAEWDCIPASAAGAPHRRDRIWIVAYARGLEHEGFGDAFRRALAAELPRAFADATSGRREPQQPYGDDQRQRAPERQERLRAGAGHRGAVGVPASGIGLDRGAATSMASAVPYANDKGRERGEERDIGPQGRVKASRRNDTMRRRAAGAPRDWWAAEPNVGRVAHGVPARVDRLHGLGNAVVPQIPEILGRAILEAQRAAA